MPPSASTDPAAPPARPAWLSSPARSLRKLMAQGADGRSFQDWVSSPKSRPKSRRPVWE